MTSSSFFRSIQKFFNSLENGVKELEARWVVFILATLTILLSKAIGLHGLADIVGFIYIMYFVTFLIDKK